jgi:hypothetical protein
LDGKEASIYSNPKTGAIMYAHMDKVSCREKNLEWLVRLKNVELVLARMTGGSWWRIESASSRRGKLQDRPREAQGE